ncbi:restriction endonuclease subunit S [Mycobacterium helveticum]|uniref:Type I restriction modification DNA specificity domain-containing protein n=1 Tax=Mycobacterium helveticum TaxID=2592811 RepID=A0A557WXW1_9MYCO|nr:restriction endonuclease subunit S [Mycobacterium helveticum]TVS77554.1 hypothetical protein FPZ46_25790 [Mycobacterium helveticum]TVS78106.1 hypothetical protein FPZ47_25560 [Mycobacterium helveticum]
MSVPKFVTVADVATVDSGPAFKSAHFGEEGAGIRLLRGDNIEPGSLRWARTKTWPRELLKGYEHLAVHEGDLILGMDRPVISTGLKLARVTKADLPALLVQRVARIRANNIDDRYLYYWLTSQEFIRHLQGSATGTQLPHVTLTSIREFRVPRFDVECERRIVDLLEDHLSRIEAGERWLSVGKRKLEALWLAALSESRRTLGGVQTRTIGDIAETALGKMLDAKKQLGRPTPYLRNVNVRWREFDLSDVQLTPLTESEVQWFDVRPGDVMVCEGGEPGRCAVWRRPVGEVAFQKALHRIRVRNSGEVLPSFLALMLEEAIRSGRCNRMFTGTTIKHLPQEKLRVIEIPVPALDTQRRAVDRLAKLVEAQVRLRAAITNGAARSVAMRRSLLTAAFSGRLIAVKSSLPSAEELTHA